MPNDPKKVPNADPTREPGLPSALPAEEEERRRQAEQEQNDPARRAPGTEIDRK